MTKKTKTAGCTYAPGHFLAPMRDEAGHYVWPPGWVPAAPEVDRYAVLKSWATKAREMREEGGGQGWKGLPGTHLREGAWRVEL